MKVLVYYSKSHRIIGESILTFDLGYYDLERFRKLKEEGIRLVMRIKKNASYVVEKEYAHSRIIRFRNSIVMRLVSLMIGGKQRDYLTDIMDMPDICIHYIYRQRWSIEIFFRTMKSYLRMDHLISKKLNGIMGQIFTALIAYIVLMMIRGMLSCFMGMREIIREIRHGIQLPFETTGNGRGTASI